LNSPARIAEEWSQLAVSDFWKLYNTELDKLMSSRLDKLRNGALDSILYTQGGVKTLEIVKALPDNIIAALAESKQGE
jgi:hypothetical protein